MTSRSGAPQQLAPCRHQQQHCREPWQRINVNGAPPVMHTASLSSGCCSCWQLKDAGGFVVVSITLLREQREGVSRVVQAALQ
jgi:hypothetical protein